MIKEYSTIEEMNAGGVSASETTIAHATEGNAVNVSGVMVQTRTPERGDACLIDADNNIVYVNGDSYVNSLLPPGWQKAGFVEWRKGRTVKVTRVRSSSMKWANYFLWLVTGYVLDGQEHAFSFAIKIGSTTYTCSGNYSGTTVAEVAASMNAIVKDFAFGPTHKYHVYERGGELILQHDTYTAYYAVTATGVTVTARVGTEIPASSAMPRLNGRRATSYGTVFSLDRALIYLRSDLDNESYNPPTDVTSITELRYAVCLPAYLGTSAYNDDHCALLREYYGDGEEGWMKYVKANMALHPSQLGVFGPSYNDGKRNTYLLAGQKAETHDGEEAVLYPIADDIAAYGFAGVKGLEPGDWYWNTIGEIYELKKGVTYPAVYQKGAGSVSVAAAAADPISRIISKMGLIQVSNATYAWGSSRFNTSSAWRCVGTYGNAGNSYYYNSRQAVASALLELPQAD